jgi:hypothetical protein
MPRTKKVAAAATETAATQEAKKYTTPADEIDEATGLYIGKPGSQARKEFERLMKLPEDVRKRRIKACKDRYIYNPNKYHMNVRIILTKELLAMSPGTQNLYADFIAGHAIDAQTREDEVNTLGAQEVTTKGRSVFDIINGKLVWPSRRWLGYFKAKTGADRKDDEAIVCDLSSYKGVFDENVSFTAEYFPVKLPLSAEGKTGICDRTMPGDGFKRPTSIKSSQTAPAGTITSFTVQTNVKTVGKKGSEMDFLDVLRECLDAGEFSGTGEWRGSGKKGTFIWEEVSDDGKVIGGNSEYYIGCNSDDPNFKDAFYDYVASIEVGEEDTLQL